MINDEFRVKENKLLNLLEYKNLTGALLAKQTNFLWLTGGRRNDVVKNEDISLVYLLLTKNGKYLIATKSDIDRIMNEELVGSDFEPVLYDWYRQSVFDVLKKVVALDKVGGDFHNNSVMYLEDDLIKLRIDLTNFEIDRVKKLCYEYSRIITDFCFSLKPGLTEKEVALEFSYICQKNNIRLPVLMVGSDERIYKYRHPVATDKKIQKYALLATIAERDGINASISRSIHFGKTPKDLLRRHKAVNYIECYYYHHSNIGVNLKDLFELGKQAYIETGFNNEWENHIQGGLIAYKPREILATSSNNLKLKANYLMGWNPTVTGAKAEDIMLLTENGPEQLSIDKKWPYYKIAIEDRKYLKPKILEI